MKDKEIKEILNKLELCCEYKNPLFVNFEKINQYECKSILDYITNLQQEVETRQYDINNLTYQLAKEKSRIDKAINEVIRVLQIILEQPSKDKLDDLWIINKLEGIQILLQGEDKE